MVNPNPPEVPKMPSSTFGFGFGFTTCKQVKIIRMLTMDKLSSKLFLFKEYLGRGFGLGFEESESFKGSG